MLLHTVSTPWHGQLSLIDASNTCKQTHSAKTPVLASGVRASLSKLARHLPGTAAAPFGGRLRHSHLQTSCPGAPGPQRRDGQTPSSGSLWFCLPSTPVSPRPRPLVRRRPLAVSRKIWSSAQKAPVVTAPRTAAVAPRKRRLWGQLPLPALPALLLLQPGCAVVACPAAPTSWTLGTTR